MSRDDIDVPESDMPVGGAQQPQTIGFLLIPDFALLSYASAIEPLRAANHLAGREIYRWSHISPDGSPVKASNGIAIATEHKVGDGITLDAIIVCAAGNPAQFAHQPTLAWLRKLAHQGVGIGGVSGGPYILARAGLLDGHRCTIHWEHVAAFSEEFPRLDLSRTLYEIDRNRLTCAGGIASLDMMRALIARDHGLALATAVSEWFLQTQLRLGSGPQRLTLRERYGVTSPNILAVLETMEIRIDEPASRQDLARIANVSIRQLERLFADHLGLTIGAQYTRIRLDRARMLVNETAMPVLDIAVACGFVSASHFSRVYKQYFGHSPRTEREAAKSDAGKSRNLARAQYQSGRTLK